MRKEAAVGTCKTCKHWNDREQHWHAPWGVEKADWGFIDGKFAKLPDHGWGYCELTVQGSGEPHYRHPESKALAADAEEYDARLMTRPDFGCVQHEPLEDGS